MKFSSVRLSIIVLLSMLMLLSACEHKSTPAKVIYRDKAEITSAPVAAPPARVVVTAPAQRPRTPTPSENVTIGLLVPLTGAQAAIGSQLRDAALMGLYDAIADAPKLNATAAPKLLIQDSAVDVTTATQKLISDGAKVILGPLVSENVVAAGAVAKQNGIPLIAFSNNSKIAQPGQFIFGFVPEQQVKRISEYAANQQIKHYAAIASQDDYGRMVVRDFAQNLKSFGYTVQPVEFFNKEAELDSVMMTRIAANAGDIGRERKGVFLPVSGAPLSIIAKRFRQDADANNGYLKLLGTGLWDNAETLSEPALRGAWFATTAPELSLSYNSRFFTQYGYAPSRVASLAYDGVSFLAQNAIRQGGAVVGLAGLTGNRFDTPANGEIRFNADGTVDRALAIVEIGAQGFSTIDAARFAQ